MNRVCNAKNFPIALRIYKIFQVVLCYDAYILGRADQYDFSICKDHLVLHVENIPNVVFYFQFRLSSMKSNYMRFDSSSTQTLD